MYIYLHIYSLSSHAQQRKKQQHVIHVKCRPPLTHSFCVCLTGEPGSSVGERGVGRIFQRQGEHGADPDHQHSHIDCPEEPLHGAGFPLQRQLQVGGHVEQVKYSKLKLECGSERCPSAAVSPGLQKTTGWLCRRATPGRTRWHLMSQMPRAFSSDNTGDKGKVSESRRKCWHSASGASTLPWWEVRAAGAPCCCSSFTDVHHEWKLLAR